MTLEQFSVCTLTGLNKIEFDTVQMYEEAHWIQSIKQTKIKQATKILHHKVGFTYKQVDNFCYMHLLP